MKSLFVLGLVVALVTGCAATRPSAKQPAKIQLMRMPLALGDMNVQALVFQQGKPSPTFINVHDDENTSVEAGKVVIEETGGRLIELSHSGKRHIRFGVEGKRYAVDPNRIFSDAGIRATLERQGDYSAPAQQAVKAFAQHYLARFALEREPVIIALHNTSDGTYSIESYRPEAEHGAAAANLYVSTNHSRYDFFYVTDARFFEYLKARDFNVVLQDNAQVPDDGSLSVYFARKRIPYMNIEAAIGQRDRQIEMVRVAREMVEEIIFPHRR